MFNSASFRIFPGAEPGQYYSTHHPKAQYELWHPAETRHNLAETIKEEGEDEHPQTSHKRGRPGLIQSCSQFPSNFKAQGDQPYNPGRNQGKYAEQTDWAEKDGYYQREYD